MKQLFLKIFSSEKNKNETHKQRLIKRSILLLFLIVIFSFAFYMLLIDNINGDEISRAKSSPSEITQYQKQISNKDKTIEKQKEEIERLEAELKVYKDKYGELDPAGSTK